MNQFKQDLNDELQSISLSEENKKFIAKKATAKMHRQKKHIHWQYRFVLTSFTLLLLSFGYLLWQQEGTVDKSRGAAPVESATKMGWSILNYDFSKVILLISFFVILRTVIKRRLHKSGRSLPGCVECSEQWTFRDALKRSMKNKIITCPHCGHKQYRTKKSARKAGLLNMFLPFIGIASLLFNNFLLGFIVYFSCAMYIIFSLSPYMIDLQEKDPSTVFLY